MAHDVYAEEQLAGVLLCGASAATAAIRRALAELGVSVVGEVADGDAALVAARRLRPDLVLIEEDLPPRGAAATVLRILQDCPTAVVVVGAPTGAAVRRALGSGAAGYLTLPLRLQDLGPALLLAHSHFRQVQLYERLGAEMREANERLLAAGLREQQLSLRLRKLAEAVTALNAAQDVDTILRIAVERGREVVGAAAAGIQLEGGGVSGRVTGTIFSGSPAARGALSPELVAFCQGRRSFRPTLARLEGLLGASPQGGTLPSRLLSATLTGPAGEPIGLLWLTRAGNEPFTEEDELVLVQIAAAASLALGHVLRFGR